MAIDFLAILILIFGIGFGAYYTMHNQNQLLYIVYTLGIVTDDTQIYKLYRMFEANNYENTPYGFNLLPPDSHKSAVVIAKPYIKRSIINEFISCVKSLSINSFKVFAIPFVISVLLGQAITLLATALLTIIVMISATILIKIGLKNLNKQKLSIILRHIYAISNQKSQLITSQISPVSNYDPSRYASVSYNVSGNNLRNSFSDNYTWQQIWWSNDLALCVIISITYIISNNGDIGDHLIGVAQIILMLQLFFVPAWLAIITCTKSISQQQNSKKNYDL